jgi:hypothetical protein
MWYFLIWQKEYNMSRNKAAAENVSGVIDRILAGMTEMALDKNFKGVAVAAYLDRDKSLIAKSKDCGKMFGPDWNILGIAFEKIAEMCDTLKDSGSNVRPVYHGECGYRGGLIKAEEGGYYMVAFSGASTEEDLDVSRHGLSMCN